jgi:hypothetical protein
MGFPHLTIITSACADKQKKIAPFPMSLNSQSETSLKTLLSFLKSHSSESFARRDVQWLFQIPKLAAVFNRFVPATLEDNDCVLGIDELDVYIDRISTTNDKYESLKDGDWNRRTRAKSEDNIRYKEPERHSNKKTRSRVNDSRK